MSFCPNLSDPIVSKQFNELVAATNNELAYLIWGLNKGNFLDKNPDGSNNPAFSILANKVGKYNALKEVGLALVDSNKTQLPSEVKPTMTPAVLDASVKTAHLKLMATVIGQKGLLGARDLITTFPSLDTYKELLGAVATYYTQDELRQIYNGNKKYINSFISEFEKPIEENTTGKNSSDYLDSNRISPDELASYTVKLALSALPVTDSTGLWVKHEQEKLEGLPIGTNYKESLDYLQKKLANTFSYEAQNKLFNEALLKRPNLRFLNNWFRFNEEVTTKDDLLLRTAFFNTFAKADVPFIIAVLGKEFRSFTPKTSREEDFLKKWESNMINSPVVSFDTAKNTYVLDVKKLKQQTETESQGATGKKITTNYYEFLKLLGYPENIKALTSSSAMEDVRFIKSQLTENIPIHEFFDKEGLKINKELLAITNAAIEASDVQESISIKDSNNNSRNSIGIPTALHLLFDQYKRGGLEYSLINNIPNNKMLKEIQAGNVEIVNLAQYKNDINTKQDFDSLDESGMAEAYVNFLLDDMYPYLPSGDRGSEYAFRVKWSHDNLPTIKNLMGVIKDINGSVAERDKSIQKEEKKTGKKAVLTQYGLPLFFGITNESQLQTKIAEEAASIKQNFERLGLKTKGIDFNEVALRYWYSFTQQGQLFTGDVTNFKDPFKRFTLFTSTRTAMINDQAFNDSLNKLYPRLDGKKADGFEKTVVLIDPTSNFPEMEEQFEISAKDYKEQKEIFDAAGAVTLDAYREIMIKSDKWNEDWDTWYDYMANKSDKRPRVAGPILKTIYSGPLFDENNEAPENVYIPAAYKSAYKVLAPRTNNAEEQKMYDKMVAKQIGIALFKSGSKLQNLALQDMNAEEFTETQNISYDYMGFNLDTSGEEHLNVTFGTQSGKLLTVDLYGKGAPNTLNTRNGVKSKDEIINSFNTHVQELDALRRKTFLENLGLEITPDNKLQVRDGNYDRLVSRIEQGLLARNTTSVTEYQVKEILRSKEKLVDALAEKTKFENMIMSIYNSDVVKRNMPGEMLVQVPDLTGELKFYTKNEKGYTNLSEIRITLPKKLVPYVKTLEGKNFSEKLATFNTMIAEGKVDKRILTLVPFRIPSQLQNAIEAVEIKAFLDPALGNTMEVPAGITVKVGSDFDVDKLTTYMPNFAITKDGLEYVTEPKDSSKLKAKVEELKSKVNDLKLEKARTLNSEEREAANISDEQYVEIIERLTDELDEIEPELQKLLDEVKYLSAFSPKKVLENKVITDFIDILTSQELQKNFLTPDSTDVLMGIGTEINNVYQKEKIDKADNTAKLSFNNVIKTRTNLLRFKSLVGQAALAATSHSLAQKAGLTYENPELRGIYFTNAPKDDIIRLDLIVNPVDGIKPSDIFKQFISASVDVSKEGNDYLVNANVNERTFPVIQALIKAGVPLRDVMYFINQPILRELQEKLDRNDSIANLNKQKQSAIADKLLKTYELNRYYYTLKNSDNITKFSTSELKGMLTTTPIKNLTELQKKKQTEILYQYEMYRKTIAADMSELQQVTAVDTKQGGKSLAENLIRKINADNLIKKKVFGNLDKMFSETILKEQKVSADKAYDLWPNVFKFALHSTENGKKLLEKFFDDFNDALTTNKINALETLDRFLTAHILLTNEVKGKTSIGSFYTRLIEKGEAVKELIKMKDKYPDNPVIKQLVPMMPDNERDTYNIKLFSRDYSAYERETLIQGFEELMVDEPEFGKKLIMQQLLQSGVSASMVSYQSILPKEYIEVTKDRLANFAFTPEQVLKDFYETMWKNPNVLKSEFIGDYKGGKMYRRVNINNPIKYLSIVAGEKVNGKNKKYLLKNTGDTDAEGNNIFTPVTLKSNYPYGINIGSINMNRGSIKSQASTPTGTINVYWGQPESSTSTKILSNLAPRKFKYESIDGVTREYGSVEHAYQSNKNGKFDKSTYDAYVAKGGFGVKIAPKLTEVGKRGNLQLMKDLVVESFEQNPNSEAAKKLLQYKNFTHNTNELIDKAFLEGLKLAQIALLKNQPKTSTTTTEESDSPFIEGESEIMSTFTKVDKVIEDAWNNLTMEQTKDLEKRKGIKSLQDFESAITDMITGGMTQEEALEDIKEC